MSGMSFLDECMSNRACAVRLADARQSERPNASTLVARSRKAAEPYASAPASFRHSVVRSRLLDRGHHTKGLPGVWPAEIDLSETPLLLRLLARLNRWLEQELVALDPRTPMALEALL